MDEIISYIKKEGQILYLEAKKLSEISSKNDLKTEPYKSLYEAREIYLKIHTSISEFIEKDNLKFPTNILLAAMNYKLGCNCFETEETSTASEYLIKSLLIINSSLEFASSKYVIGLHQELLNQLGILESDRGNFEKSLEYLLESKKHYNTFCIQAIILTVDDLFTLEAYSDNFEEARVSKQKESFEDNYTLTLYFLAQIYGKMEKCQDSACYCKETLNRQLVRNKYKPIEWALHAATLSQYYFSINDYKMARHCLATGELILKENGEKPRCLTVKINKEDTQNVVDEKEQSAKSWADIYRCWTKYAIALLEFSKDRLLSRVEDILSNSCNINENNNQSEELFNINVDSIENDISHGPILVFYEARELFLKAKYWITSSKEFYQIDGHCSDFIELTRDHSTLYKLLAFFETDLERQCKMHKRRIDLLSEVLKKLNKQFYLLVCCQLAFEIGETYSCLLDNKLDLLEINLANENPSEKESARKKINILATKGIEYFKIYLNYLCGKDGKLPNKFSTNDERPALIAHFYCGRLFSKIVSHDQEENLKNMKKSFEYYSFVVDYCKLNPDAVENVKEENDACSEIVKLLPARMDQLKSQF